MLKSSDVDKLTKAEIKSKLEEMEEEGTFNKPKRKMRTTKKALYTSFAIALMLIVFSMIMIVFEKDTSTLEILATAGVGVLPIMYGIYTKGSTQINLKHMEMDYDPNYDENNQIY